MELSTLGRGVYEGDLPLVRSEIEQTDEEVIQEAMLVSVMHVINKKHQINKRVVRRLLDKADANWKTIRGESLLYLAISSATPGEVGWSPSESAISIGDEVIGKASSVPQTKSSMGPIWLEGIVVDSVDANNVRVHFADIGSSTTLPRGPEGSVSDIIPEARELTPGIQILFKQSSIRSDDDLMFFQQSSSNNFITSQTVKFDKYKTIRKIQSDNTTDYYLEGTLSAINVRGGYDVTSADGTVHQNIVSESIRILKKVSLGYKPIARALIIQGQQVRVIEKGTSESWRGVIKGRNTSGGFEVLYPDDGDFETDVPVVELFTPVMQPSASGGGSYIVSELLSRDADVGIALPVACKQNNKTAIELMLKHSKRPYLGLTTVACANGLRIARVVKKGPASGILLPDDVIVTINDITITKGRGPFYWEYCNRTGNWDIRILRKGEMLNCNVEAIENRFVIHFFKFFKKRKKKKKKKKKNPNRLDHDVLYLRQKGLDLTQSEDISKLLIQDGAKMNISKCIQRHWYDVAELLLDLNKSEIDPNEEYRGRYALELAARVGYISIVEKLLRMGAKVNSVSFLGHTPLLSACLSPFYSTRLYLVKLLIKNGARPKGTRALAAALKKKPRWHVGMNCMVTIPDTTEQHLDSLSIGKKYPSKIMSRDKEIYSVLIQPQSKSQSQSFSVNCEFSDIEWPQWPIGTQAVDTLGNEITVTKEDCQSPLSDVPRGKTLLMLCRILLNDPSLKDSEKPTRRRFRPVGLLERFVFQYKKNNDMKNLI